MKTLQATNAEHETKEAVQQERLDALQVQSSMLQAELAQVRDELIARDNRIEALRIEVAAERAVQEEVRHSLEGQLEDLHVFPFAGGGARGWPAISQSICAASSQPQRRTGDRQWDMRDI